MELKNELASSRWRRWRDYIDSGKSEKVIDEFEKYAKHRQPNYGDVKLREEAFRNIGLGSEQTKKLGDLELL